MYFVLKNKIVGRIKLRLFPPELFPESEREEVRLPPQGESISVEQALNSRCCSDSTENQRYFHWGMFDKTRKLANKHIAKVVRFAQIPRYTDIRVGVTANGTMLTFMIDSHASGIERDRAMVESGMQQQAVGLACAALGIGMVFKNLSKDGLPLSDNNYGNVRIQLDAMRPGYNGSFWSSLPPEGTKHWLPGNLPDPVRNGNQPLLSVLKELQLERNGSNKFTEASLSQLLWAAKGRTPHLYKSKPWGMTIPLWTDRIEVSTLIVIKHGKLWKYVNWDRGRPTHSLYETGEINWTNPDQFYGLSDKNQHLIILAKNDNYARAYWEIGYQLLNSMLQSHVLNIPYRSFLLDKPQKDLLRASGINDPVAVLVV